MLSFDLVVVGGGIAGVSAVEQACLRYPHASVMLMSASPYVKIANTQVKLSKHVEELYIQEEPLQDFLAKFKNLTVVSAKLEHIYPNKHVVEDSCKRKFEYKKLCLCTGSHPKKFNYESEHIITLRDTDSAVILQEKIAQSRVICIIGNGGIATELAYELKNISIVWVIRDSHISSPFLDSGAAEFLLKSRDVNRETDNQKPAKLHRYTISGNRGSEKSSVPGCALGPDWHSHIQLAGALNSKTVTIEYNTELESLSDKMLHDELLGHWPVYVTLKNGKKFGCDLIVNATGVVPSVPNIQEAPPFQLASDGGITVNESMETSLPDIYAAGDVCSINFDTPLHWFQMRLWSQARPMGAYAGLCATASFLNKDKPLVDFSFELFTHVTRFFGFRVVFLGLFNGQKLDGKYEALVRVTKDSEYIKLIVQGGRIHGAVLIGETGMEETFENLILNQLDISEFGENLLNPEIDIDDFFD